MAGSTLQATKAWETRRKNGTHKNSAESNQRRKQTMLAFAQSEPEWVEFCRAAALGNKASTGMAPPNKGKTWEDSFGIEGAKVYRERHAKLMAAAYKTSGTDIELITKDFLDRSGIPYVFQVAMYGTVVDFYFPDTKTILLVDGCYWHGHTKEYPTLSDTQVARQRKDDVDNRRLTQSGHLVIRIWGCELDNLNRLTKILIGGGK